MCNVQRYENSRKTYFFVSSPGMNVIEISLISVQILIYI